MGKQTLGRQADSGKAPPKETDGMNVVIVDGEIATDPLVRELPSGDTLLAFDVRVRVVGRAAQSVPVSWIGTKPERFKVEKGKSCVVVGSMHRRFYRPQAGGLQSRVDLRADKILVGGPAKRRLAVSRFVKKLV